MVGKREMNRTERSSAARGASVLGRDLERDSPATESVEAHHATRRLPWPLVRARDCVRSGLHHLCGPTIHEPTRESSWGNVAPTAGQFGWFAATDL